MSKLLAFSGPNWDLVDWFVMVFLFLVFSWCLAMACDEIFARIAVPDPDEVQGGRNEEE